MGEDGFERRLAAILVADVVGYSRLMGEDEAATLEAMDEHRFAVINPTIGQFHGRIVKLMGDGILVEFPSVLEAVECAISIQQDGVNIAARLQEQADPNGVCISSTVYNQIEGKTNYVFADAGAHQFKNIASAIRIYKHNVGTSERNVEVAFRPFIDLPAEEKPFATGGCLCGNVRYEISGKALGSMLCHCRMCQKAFGSFFARA